MANKNTFRTQTQKAPDATTVNNAGGRAYALSDKEALAQLIMTGTFNNTFYTDSANQVDNVTKLLGRLGDENAEFVAKLAVYARSEGFMKDTPAFLLAWLSSHGSSQLFKQVFDLVVDNGKMLRNFVQIMRSGAVGRKSLGSAPKKKVQDWILHSPTMHLLRASVGNAPSLVDIFKMVHPRPQDLKQAALFKWFLGGSLSRDEMNLLPSFVQDLIKFRKGETQEIPRVPFELLTSMELTADQWKAIAENGGWQMIRMNLNTFGRKGLYSDPEFVHMLSTRLMNREEISKAKVMPYQLFTTFLNLAGGIPSDITASLERALEHSLLNVPTFSGKTLVFVDVSGSMSSPITGHRQGATTKMRCVDVASLIASSLLRVNPNNTDVSMFDTRVHQAKLDPKASVMANAHTISRFGGGGTSCQLPLIQANDRRTKADLVIYISDNESWFNTNRSYYGSIRSTETAEAWAVFKKRNPEAKMVCIDLQPGMSTQAPSTDPSVLNVGGFNDSVYRVIEQFIQNKGDVDFWTQLIERSVSL